MSTPAMPTMPDVSANVVNAWRAVLGLPIALGAETLRFAGQRMQAQAQHLSEICACGSFESLVASQSRFANAVLADYQAEAQRLSKTVQDGLSGAGRPASA